MHKSYEMIHNSLQHSWNTIAPFWPLKNLIAVNPLQGYEGLNFEAALQQAQCFSTCDRITESLKKINRFTIKWLQVLSDEGQAYFSMPSYGSNKYDSWKKLIIYDTQLHANSADNVHWISHLPENPLEVIERCLNKLRIEPNEYTQFITFLLSSLSGWASYVRYGAMYTSEPFISQEEYVALRLIITCLIEPQARTLLKWQHNVSSCSSSWSSTIATYENDYQTKLYEKFKHVPEDLSYLPDAQFLFCIDVRSEPVRKALEESGHYETYGIAGFFGLPITVHTYDQELYQACPVILKPTHTIMHKISKNSFDLIKFSKKFYQSLKYNVVTSFALVETLGLASALWMSLKKCIPVTLWRVKNKWSVQEACVLDTQTIELSVQIEWAFNLLTTISLTTFAPLIVLVGHKSVTENNPFSSALDCGACAGRPGGTNALIMSHILNNPQVRAGLVTKGIIIPESTHFIPAQHITTTDEIIFLEDDLLPEEIDVSNLKIAFAKVRKHINYERAIKLGYQVDKEKVVDLMEYISKDWSQVQPEWGLARNACFIIAPRWVTHKVDLEGRAFLHSYDYRNDVDGSILKSILAGPAVVGQWINTCYLFSSLDPVMYGAGSKITANITGKIGVMQGNASDLMTGLPVQSVYKDELTLYHEPVRLIIIIYAPLEFISQALDDQDSFKNLIKNKWVHCSALDPEPHTLYRLNSDLSWQQINEV